MIRGRHRASGEHALLQKLSGGLCLAQFDRLSHPQSHHWHLYLRRDFAIVRHHPYRWKTAGDPTPRHGSPTARRARPPEMQSLPR